MAKGKTKTRDSPAKKAKKVGESKNGARKTSTPTQQARLKNHTQRKRRLKMNYEDLLAENLQIVAMNKGLGEGLILARAEIQALREEIQAVNEAQPPEERVKAHGFLMGMVKADEARRLADEEWNKPEKVAARKQEQDRLLAEEAAQRAARQKLFEEAEKVIQRASAATAAVEEKVITSASHANPATATTAVVATAEPVKTA